MVMGRFNFVQYNSPAPSSLLKTRDPSSNHWAQTLYLLQQHAELMSDASDSCLKSKARNLFP